ncbi:MAG: DUF58 domain-containing protein [Armatimonadetes bacterium]|nr:DUF58 domain-containing protein [Armatimonadota bacterium]
MLVPTVRLALLIAGGGLILAPGLGRPALLPIAVGWNLLLLAAVLADALLLPRREQVRIARRCAAAFSLGESNRVVLEVRNHSPRALRLRLVDQTPALCAEPEELPAVLIAPGAGREVPYRLVAERRGRDRFGGVTARWRGPFGLLERQAHWPLEQAVKVYPNLRALQRYELLQRAGRLLEAGLRAARLRGAGTEFESLREYQPDDDYRRIHWGATARRRKLVSRQYEVERSQTVLLCLDVGRLMTTPIGPLTRLDHAVNAILFLAGVAMRLQDKVGLLVFAEEPLAYLPPRAGKAQLNRILESLYDLEGRYVEPDYGAALRLLGLRQRKRSLVVLFTDLVDTAASEALLTYTTALRPAHLPIFVSFRDPATEALRRRAPATVTDVYERALAAQVLGRREAALDRLRGHGIAIVDAPPEEAPAALVNRYIETKVRLLL